MDLTQTVAIPLSEYLELKELKEHGKEVKITEYLKRINGKNENTGISVSWKSDGKCWIHLAGKMRSFGDEYSEIFEKYTKLKNMTVKEFKQHKKS